MNITKELKKIALDLLDYGQLYQSDIGHMPHPGSDESCPCEECKCDPCKCPEMKESLTKQVMKNQDGLRDLVPD